MFFLFAEDGENDTKLTAAAQRTVSVATSKLRGKRSVNGCPRWLRASPKRHASLLSACPPLIRGLVENVDRKQQNVQQIHTHTHQETLSAQLQEATQFLCSLGVFISTSSGTQTLPQLPLLNTPTPPPLSWWNNNPLCAATQAPQPFDVLSTTNLICIQLVAPVFTEPFFSDFSPPTTAKTSPNVNIVRCVFHTAWCTFFSSSFAAQCSFYSRQQMICVIRRDQTGAEAWWLISEFFSLLFYVTQTVRRFL